MMRHKLESTSIEERKKIEQSISETLLSSAVWQQAKVIGITISQGIEWDTKSIIRKAWQQGKTICVPKSYPQEHKMVFYKINSFTQVVKQYGNLLEPIPQCTERMKKSQIDLLIVPGLLFDQWGFRIGFGGGYYDRFLSDFPNETLSLLSRSQLVDKIPTEVYDIPVNCLIMENEIIKQ